MFEIKLHKFATKWIAMNYFIEVPRNTRNETPEASIYACLYEVHIKELIASPTLYAIV